MFFLKAIQLPSIFDYFMKLLASKHVDDKTSPLGSIIFTHLLSEEYESKINPTNGFNQEQLETMLDTTMALLSRNMHTGFGGCTEAIRSIYYLENPLAKPWLLKYHKNKSELQKLVDIDSKNFSEFYKEINRSIESALEYVSDREQYAYLEFKDAKSDKFWEITFLKYTYYIIHGEIGTDGKKSNKSFSSIEETRKAGQKLIASKIKKGYRKTTKPYSKKT